MKNRDRALGAVCLLAVAGLGFVARPWSLRLRVPPKAFVGYPLRSKDVTVSDGDGGSKGIRTLLIREGIRQWSTNGFGRNFFLFRSAPSDGPRGNRGKLIALGMKTIESHRLWFNMDARVTVRFRNRANDVHSGNAPCGCQAGIKRIVLYRNSSSVSLRHEGQLNILDDNVGPLHGLGISQLLLRQFYLPAQGIGLFASGLAKAVMSADWLLAASAKVCVSVAPPFISARVFSAVVAFLPAIATCPVLRAMLC